jgi:NSS family neurotransmitter:Na+ symporter
MAHERGVTVPEVTKSGIGLAFVVFPDAVSLMPVPHLFALLLFVTMFTLGIDSAFGLIESVNSVMHHQFPKVPLSIISLIVCIAGFLAGIPYTLSNGFYLLDIVDHFVSDYCLILIGICECVVVGYFIASVPLKDKILEARTMITEHGLTKCIAAFMYAKILLLHSADEFREKITAVSKRGPYVLWSLLIKFLIPFLLGGIWLSQIIKELINPYSTRSDGSYDLVSMILGGCIVGFCMLIILIYLLVPSRKRKQEKHDEMVMTEISLVFDTPLDRDIIAADSEIEKKHEMQYEH